MVSIGIFFALILPRLHLYTAASTHDSLFVCTLTSGYKTGADIGTLHERWGLYCTIWRIELSLFHW
jgi:hypothetical protein